MIDVSQLEFENYHIHSCDSNIFVADSAVTKTDYAKRVKELGQQILSSCEHGYQGRYYNTYDVAKEYGLKFVFGCEAYWVKDRLSKDRSNCHICIFAKNEKGRKAINNALSEANISGFYYRPRLDLKLILDLPADDVFVTSACFTDKMKVQTKEEYKPIKSVLVGDLVLTHKGTWEKIAKKTTRKYKDDLYRLNIEGNINDIECTKDHLFPTIEKTHNSTTKEIVWKKARELQTTDRILSVVDESYTNIESIDFSKELNVLRNTNSKRRKHIKCDSININNEFLELLGIYAAEGSFLYKGIGIRFTLNSEDTMIIEKTKKYMKDIFGIDPCVKHKQLSKAIDFEYCSTEIYTVFNTLFESGAVNKKTPQFIKNLSPYLQMQFIKGLFNGDGHFSKDKERITFATVSSQMAYDVIEMLERNDVRISVITNKDHVDKDNIHHCEAYYIYINAKKYYKYFETFRKYSDDYEFDINKNIEWESKKPIVIDGVKYQHKKIKKITTEEYDGDVFCLEVENTHSFKIENISTHNCVGFWMKSEKTEEEIQEPDSESEDFDYIRPEKTVVQTKRFVYKYDDIEDIVLTLYNRFRDNFMLEVQYHHTDLQKLLNQKIQAIALKYNIKMIMGCDSHYIFPHQSVERDIVLEAKNVFYDEEYGWYMDYPDAKTAFRRFKEQEILTEEEIVDAMTNTLVFRTFDNIEFDKNIKLPTLYPNLTQQEKNNLYKKLIMQEWERFKVDIPESEHERYKHEIRDEVRCIINTGMADYFLLDYEIVKDAVANGGVITSSGRGSGSSFLTNTLLGFSKVDRVSAPVKLYPERFISETRILETASLPDLDMNLSDPEIFAQSQKKLLGEDHAYPMIAFGTFKKASAFKIYARAKKLPAQLQNEITAQIEEYDKAVKYADDDDKADINLMDFVDEQYHSYIKESEKYYGIIADRKQAPCGYLLYSGSIREDIGLILCKSETTGKEVLTTVVDGGVAEYYKFLKNDLLKVDVVLLIDKIYKRIGINPHSVLQLQKIITNNEKVWKIYENGLTMGINQVEKASTTKKVMKYKPQNISELTAFVAAIRPSFKSMYTTFESRIPFSYNIPSFDRILQTEEMPNSFVLYQEQMMATLAYAGFHRDETYSIIKAISKKKPAVVKPLKERFIAGFSEVIIRDDNVDEETAKEMCEKVWQIIDDSAGYGFNASHAYCVALDSVYGAYLKSHYPFEFYETMLRHYAAKNKDKVALFKQEMKKGFNIKVGEIKFGKDNRDFIAYPEQNEITQSLYGIKYMNEQVADDLYGLGMTKFVSFIDILYALQHISINSRQLEILVKLNYFSEYGRNQKLLTMIEYFDKYGKAKTIKKDAWIKAGLHEKMLDGIATSTDKTYKNIDNRALMQRLWDITEDKTMLLVEQVNFEMDHAGYVITTLENLKEDYCVVLDIEYSSYDKTKSKPYLVLHHLKNGEKTRYRIVDEKTFTYQKVGIGDIIWIKKLREEPKQIIVDKKRVKSETDFNYFIDDWINIASIGKTKGKKKNG